MGKFYRVSMLLLKLISLPLFVVFEWMLTWWFYLTYLSTDYLHPLLIMSGNLILVTVFLFICLITYYKYDNHITQVLAVCLLALIGYLIYYFNGSSQWIFEELTSIMKNFIGTIPYMFAYTRLHTDALKIYSYIGCAVLGGWLLMAGYIWCLSVSKYFSIYPRIFSRRTLPYEIRPGEPF